MLISLANDCDYDTKAVCSAPTNLLVNGGFEDTPAITANGGQWQIFPSITGWLTGLSDGVEVWRNFDGNGAGSASEGVQNVELDANRSTKITQPAVTIPGATYKLSFDFSAREMRDLADNQMQVAVGGNNFMQVAADGTGNTINEWASHAKTFVASASTTTISLEDVGTSNSFGTLVDDVVLCLVSLPVIDVCPEDGVQTDVSQCAPAPVESCEVLVVSDTTNTVVERANAFAQIISYPWTAMIEGASWIWADATVQEPKIEENYTFEKKFNWNGPTTNTVLDIAADNSYEVFLNGTSIGFDTAEDNHSSADQISGFALAQGENTLSIKVKNFAQSGGTEFTNPAGLRYKLTATGNNSVDCKTTPSGTGGGGDGDGNGDDGEDEDFGRGGGSSTGTRVGSRDGVVAGESISPTPLVLGEQVSAVPTGAPDAGAGGASPVSTNFSPVVAAAILERNRKNV